MIYSKLPSNSCAPAVAEVSKEPLLANWIGATLVVPADGAIKPECVVAVKLPVDGTKLSFVELVVAGVLPVVTAEMTG